MFDFSTLPISPDLCRAARNYLGYSQAKAAEESGLPVHKFKRFEAGNFIPDLEFLQGIRAFYEERGYPFEDLSPPGAAAKEKGLVFPSGVVGKTAESPAELQSNRPSVASFHHMRIALQDPEMGEVLDRIDANEQKVDELLRLPIETGFFGGIAEATQVRHAEAVRLLSENGVLFARLFGREIGGKPKPQVLAKDAEPETQADLLHGHQADVHLAVAGDRDAKARLQDRKPATSVVGALFS